MRTTLTLDEDVAAQLRRLRKRLKLGLKELVNRGLREGLARLENPPAKRRGHRTLGRDMGPCLIGSLDDVAEALAIAEGEAYR